MSGLLNNSLFLSTAAAAGGYQVQRSLRFNSSDSAYLSRTPAVAGNRRTWTWAGWVKRTVLGTGQRLFSNANSGNTQGSYFDITSSNTLDIYDWSSGWVWQIITSQVFRDASAWYHILLAFDTTQATGADRVKLYINGVQVTAFASATYPSSNYESYWNSLVSGNELHAIGRNGSAAASYFDGYLADIHFIDGQALTPSSFTEVSATTGQLIPKTYTGTFGTNGFWLKFSDNSAATAATLGKDYSPNGNNWTPNNLSVTAGAGNDSLVDTPTSIPATDTGVGGSVRGNYCTWNPLTPQWSGMTYGGGWGTLSNGNLNIVTSGLSQAGRILGTFGMSSGKWYWETTVNSTDGMDVGLAAFNSLPVTNGWLGTDAKSYAYSSGGDKRNNNTGTAYGATYGTGDTIGVAFDADNGTLVFYKNGVSQGTAFTGLTSGPYFAGESYVNRNTSANFGQRAFAYTAPSGFKALCDTNLGAPLVAKPSTVFDVITYTGTGSSLTLPNGSSTPTSISFTPDFAWLKGRSGATNHALYDAVRGVQKDLVSNSTSAETTETTGLTAFGTNTFTVGSLAKLNTSSSTYVAWAWNAGGSTVSNTSGSITSQVRANASAGFSVVTYTGTGANATVGHGLGVAPSMIFVKQRSGTSTWRVYHASLANTQVLYLSATDAATTETTAWNSTTPTSSVVSLGTGNGVNGSSSTYVAYCFSSVVGYSSFGSYLANANSDGPFVYTGFKPRFVLCKLSSAAGADWLIFDTARSPYNVVQANLRPNTSGAEESAFARIDILSNGFKVRAGSGVEPNGTNGNTYIYAAWAEFPFQYSRAA